MITLDLDKTKALLSEAVAERGANYVYKRPGGSLPCLYVHGTGVDAKPGCIVGWVLHKAGLPLEALEPYNSRGVRTTLSALDAAGLPLASPGAEKLLAGVQVHQDAGQSWGDAVSLALDSAG